MLRFFKLRGKLLLPKSIIVLDDLRGVVPADLLDGFLHFFEITESAHRPNDVGASVQIHPAADARTASRN
jgi:hypothetical protein